MSRNRRVSTISGLLVGDHSVALAEGEKSSLTNIPPQSNARRAPEDAIAEEPVDEKSTLDATTQSQARPGILARASSNFSRLSGRGSSLKERLSVADRISVSSAFKRKRASSSVSPLHVQRAIIRRQLRLTFIYPLVYLLMWMAPFVLHCMQYNIYYAKQPPFALGIIANTCYTLMAAVDCAIFCYRERPWRHIPKNRTRGFWTSFACWGTGGDAEYNPTDDERGRGRWGSNGEKDKSRLRTGKRNTRGQSYDSATSDELEASLPGPAARLGGKRLPPAKLVRLAPDFSQTDQLDAQRIDAADWQDVANNPVSLPGAVAAHNSRSSLKGFFQMAQRSDGQKAAEEAARIRLAREMEDRRALEEQRLSDGPAEQAAERHWWDGFRRDSLPEEWEGRRKSLFGMIRSGGSSEKSSPAQSPGERTGPLNFPEITLAVASSPRQVWQGLHGIQEEADGGAPPHSTDSED